MNIEKTNSDRASFTAADALPLKLLQHGKLIQNITENRTILPLHVQLIPTNRCNLKCSFCSCDNRNRNEIMDCGRALDLVRQLSALGTEGVTITGGGEPLTWPHLWRLLKYFGGFGIKTGLVTNGVLLSNQHQRTLDSLKTLTWCRISQGDARELWKEQFLSRLSSVIRSTPVDWAFSYVVSDKPDVKKIARLLRFASDHRFTHVRLVADLLCTDKIPMDDLRKELNLDSITVPVIFQDRKQPEHGSNCRVCYLRPVITPDMKIYACCGAQYALAEPSLDFPAELCLGTVDEFPEIIVNSSKPFEGAKLCKTCYYGNYNRALDMLMTPVMHGEFL